MAHELEHACDDFPIAVFADHHGDRPGMRLDAHQHLSMPQHEDRALSTLVTRDVFLPSLHTHAPCRAEHLECDMAETDDDPGAEIERMAHVVAAYTIKPSAMSATRAA